MPRSKILICFIVLLFSNLRAQIFYADSLYPYYTDINPDFYLYMHYNGGGSSTGSTSDMIDINGDGVKDLVFKASYNTGLGGGKGSIYIIPLNSKIGIRSRFNATINARIVEPLQAGDSINSISAVWDTTRSLPAYFIDTVGLIINYGFRTLPNPPTRVTDWTTDTDLYAGIRYINSNDTIFGWIRIRSRELNVGYVDTWIKDLSFGQLVISSSAGSVLCKPESAMLTASGANSYTWSTGQNGSSIVVMPSITSTYTVNGTTASGYLLKATITQSVNACQLNIYPNPANDKLVIEGLEIEKCSLITVDGKEIPIELNSQQELDVSTLPSALYFLKLQTEEGILTKKIVIQH